MIPMNNSKAENKDAYNISEVSLVKKILDGNSAKGNIFPVHCREKKYGKPDMSFVAPEISSLNSEKRSKNKKKEDKKVVETTKLLFDMQGSIVSPVLPLTDEHGVLTNVLTRVESERNVSVYEDEVRNAKRRKKKRKSRDRKEGQSSGRWTQKEHEAFLEGLQQHGREWKKVAIHIKTRTSAQIRSHAQKYFARIEKEDSTNGFCDQSQFYVEDDVKSGLSPALKTRKLSLSTLAKIDAIMHDPHAVEDEVISTLRALEERYRELQARIATRQRFKQHQSETLCKHHIISPIQEASISTLNGIRSKDTDNLNGCKQSKQRRPGFLLTEHKVESIDSTVQSLLPCNKLKSISRKFDSEEITALQVLGSSFPLSIMYDRMTGNHGN